MLCASGCGAVGRVGTGDAAHGKELFLSPSVGCGNCHSLADAKSQGTIGPNLDYAFEFDKQQGFSTQTMKDIVRGQIAYPIAPMPANLVRGQDADDIATYIAQCSGNPNCGVTAEKPAGSSSGSSSSGSATSTTPSSSSGSSSAGGALSASATKGKAVFTSAGCSGCHTLKNAGSHGNIGPNLDQLKPSLQTVMHQVENGGGAMPAFKNSLTQQQITDVSTYVSSVAGK